MPPAYFHNAKTQLLAVRFAPRSTVGQELTDILGSPFGEAVREGGEEVVDEMLEKLAMRTGVGLAA